MDMLQQLRRLNTETSTLDELIALEVFAKQLEQGYTSREIPAPDWLTQALQTLGLEIVAKTRAQLELRLREARSRQATLRTREERRSQADAEVEALEKALGRKVDEPAKA